MAHLPRRKHEQSAQSISGSSAVSIGMGPPLGGHWVYVNSGGCAAGYKAEHSHEGEQVAVFSEGSEGIAYWYSASGKRVARPFKGAHIWVVPAGVRHAVRFHAPTQCVLIELKPSFSAEAGGGMAIREASFRPIQWYLAEDRFVGELLGIVREWSRIAERPGPVYAEMIGGSLARHVIRALLAPRRRERESRVGLAPNVRERVIAYMRAHISEKLSRKDLSRVAGMSEWHFGRLFRISEGVPLMKRLREMRLEESKSLLLAGDRTISEVAHMTGFGDHSNFTERFRERFGIPPSKYRRRWQAPGSKTGFGRTGSKANGA